MEKTVETLCNKPWRQIEMRSNNNRNVKKEIPAGTVTLYGEGGGEEEITRICGRVPHPGLSGQVKQERAQGGCLGTESRRKT